jgi:hypothetical protein
LRVDFATDPNPPHQGFGNQLTVKLTREDGTLFSGADVSVVFFMPAMPEMNMAAVNTPARLRETNPGSYRGTLSLPYGGSYQVTVRVRQNGQQLTVKQLTVHAEGGM